MSFSKQHNRKKNSTLITEASQVLDNLPDGITIQDLDFNIIYQNSAMQKAFGKRSEPNAIQRMSVEQPLAKVVVWPKPLLAEKPLWC